MALIYTFGHISGAHVNPAVTIGFLIYGDINKREAFYYIVSQLFAGIAASFTLFSLFGNVGLLGTTLPEGPWLQSLLWSFFLPFS